MAHQMLLTALVQLDLIKHPRLISHAGVGLLISLRCIWGSLIIKHMCCTLLEATQVSRPSDSDIYDPKSP